MRKLRDVANDGGFVGKIDYPSRFGLMLPANRARIEAQHKALNESRLPDEKRREILMSTAGDRMAEMELAGARRDRINIDINADIMATQFFEHITLKNDQIIELYNESNQQYEVKVISQLGGAPTDMFINQDEVSYYYPYEVKSDLIFYPVRHAALGDLQLSDRLNERVRYNVARKIDKDVMTLWNSVFGTFPTGAFNVDPDNVSFPTSNLINSPGSGSITVALIKQIFALSLRLDVKVRIIKCSPLDLPGVWDWAPVYNAAGSPSGYNEEVSAGMREQIQTSGLVNNIFGYNVTWLTDNTQASGSLYCATDQPAGKYYEKPGMDRVIMYTEKEIELGYHRQNTAALQMVKVIELLVPEFYYKNSIKAIFKP